MASSSTVGGWKEDILDRRYLRFGFGLRGIVDSDFFEGVCTRRRTNSMFECGPTLGESRISICVVRPVCCLWSDGVMWKSVESLRGVGRKEGAKEDEKGLFIARRGINTEGERLTTITIA